MLTIQSLKDRVHSWLSTIGADIGSAEHKIASAFVLHVEDVEAERDAIELLHSKGYRISAPPAAPAAN